jgi:RNA polymerase sigma-70 factor, ECF subfamily
MGAWMDPLDAACATTRERLRILYEAHAGVVYRRARKLLRDDQLARDACHDVFVRLLREPDAWELQTPVAWLFRVTTNHCLTILRDRKRRRRLLDGLVGILWRDRTEPELSLQQVLRDVPPHLQEVALYHAFDGMTQAEIAHAMKVSPKTVFNRLRELREHQRNQGVPVAPEEEA